MQQDPFTARIFGSAAETTGGRGRRLLLVTSPDDMRDAVGRPGTLRWAIDTARREGGAWITFGPAVQGRTIRLGSGLRLPSNTTLDGGCGGTTLHAPASATTLLVLDTSNVIVARLRFTKEPYSEPGDRIGDAVGLSGRFDRVAILHNAFSRCGDGCVDVVRREPIDAPGRVTVAFNRFETHNKVLLVGTLACTATRRLEGCEEPLEHLAGTFRPNIRVTLLANTFVNTSQRHPKVVANGFVQSVNNLLVLAPTRYADGRSSAVYGAAAASGGLLASLGDVLVNPAGRTRIGIGPVSAQRDGDVGEESDGAVLSRGAVRVGAIQVVPSRAELVQAELAREQPVPVLDAAANPHALAACLLRHAGPDGAGHAWPDVCNTVQSAPVR